MACRELSPDESIIAQQHLMGNTVKSGIKPKGIYHSGNANRMDKRICR